MRHTKFGIRIRHGTVAVVVLNWVEKNISVSFSFFNEMFWELLGKRDMEHTQKKQVFLVQWKTFGEYLLSSSKICFDSFWILEMVIFSRYRKSIWEKQIWFEV